MIYRGHIENGVVVFAEPVPLTAGTEVRVGAVESPAADFWESCSLDDGADRVHRGGAWDDFAISLHCAGRHKNAPAVRYQGYRYRLART